MRIAAANKLSQKKERNRMRLFFPSSKRAGILQGKLLLTPHTVSSSLCVCIGYTFIKYYVNELVAESVNQYIKRDQLQLTTPAQPSVPKPLCSEFERPNKEDAIQRHKSRFTW